ncbi:MAG: class I SAM-dependent methyltransferase [Candidatus Magnetomorum sp.]|nr:class I SAM-dependent methyltransferase [Candidatus Magnetomorum sp.]
MNIGVKNNQAVARRFNHVAKQFESIIDAYSVSRRHNIVLPHLFGKVLSTGSGPGLFEATHQINTLIHMDIAVDMCKVLRQKRHIAVCGDAESLPVSNESLDGIVALEMLYYLNCPDHFLSEAFRVLKPGGHLMISSFNQRLKWYDRLIRRMLRVCSIGPQYFDDPVERFFYQKELKDMILHHGFSIDCQRSILIVPFKNLKSLDERLEKTFFQHLAMFHVFVARKPL